ncbi:ParB/RepB/Spo0J family partition protein [Brytella acorum]|uniref:ParB N-terminal domain-containing protein n=1 Tax=Brytella acorum TaxID=2959299 RepID=A0AA35UQW3_9PROT|nr:ParB N-terminal domain-containing protein [Brytella acorum]CAI9120469.1 ParB N-terminal domain-containing protein [Brytella acorum]
MNVQELPISAIDQSGRLRAVDPDYVALLASSIEDHGLRQPIEVRKTGRNKYALVSGCHRLNAAILLQHESILANVVEADDLQAQLLEIDENLFRRELSPLDRATFLARRKEVYEELHPETKQGGDRKSDQTDKLVRLIPTFTEATAEKLGLDARTIRRSVARHTNIPTDVREKISGTWLADSGSQLDALAALAPDMQRAVADFVAQWPGVRQVKEIVRQISNRPREPKAGKLEKFLAFFRKCDSDERQAIVEYAAEQMPAVAFEAAWDKASDYNKRSIVDLIAPSLPGFAVSEAA